MFNVFDIAALCIILACGYFGFQTGIIASFFYVASGFAGMWAAQRFAVPFGVNFYLVFLGAAAVVILAGFLLNRLCRVLLLGSFDRITGGILGLLLGIVFTGLVLQPLAQRMSAPVRAVAVRSYCASRIFPIFSGIFPVLRERAVDELKGRIPLVVR